MSEFEELYNLYYKDVYYFVLKLTGYQDHMAEEVTQESFYQAFISLKRFRGECSIKSWLCQIAKNTYYKYLKTHAKEIYLEEELHQEQEEKTVSTVVEEKQMTLHIRKVIADLDQRSRSIVEYRLNSKVAADLSGRLNFESEMIASYEWKDNYHFYIYDSYSCYDVIGVEKTWHGWKKTDSCLNWPKWSMYNENLGIEVAGALCHFQYYEGVQIFPIIPYDPNVKTVEVTCYEQTQTKNVKTGELTLFTFDAIYGETNKVEATAYDAKGNVIYRLADQDHHWIWVSATE